MDHPEVKAIAALIFTIPVLAVIGGIIGGILRARGRQRLAELVHRERIAAIERGVDPDKLPPPPPLGPDFKSIAALAPTNAQKAQGFLVTGIMLLGAGFGLIAMLLLLPDPNANGAWAAGLMPLSIGVALLVSSRIVGRSREDDRTGG